MPATDRPPGWGDGRRRRRVSRQRTMATVPRLQDHGETPTVEPPRCLDRTRNAATAGFHGCRSNFRPVTGRQK